MRTAALLIWIPIFLASASMVRAQEEPARPTTPAPAADAPYEQRETWCLQYTAWVVKDAADAAQGQPNDVRATHLLEVELNDCKRDPQAYERVTGADLPSGPHAAG